MNDATRALIAAGTRLPLAGFVLDLGGEQLRDAQGNSVELRPQAWAVLRHLALSAGRLVSKEELLDAIWPGLVVTEGSLTQAISDVRGALGEPGHRVIKTVPKRGYKLVADSGESTTRLSPPTNLPAEADILIGREADITALTQWLTEHRLVTVLGTGGIGKTRLARSVARERRSAHANGVWWIDLAALSSAEQIAPAIALAANLQVADGDATAVLVRSLAHRDMLLVLDNCEHLAAEVAGIAQAILAGAPEVSLLATSQEVLRVAGEHIYRLETLAVPPPGTPLDVARRYSALQLLEQRAHAADRHFALGEDTIGSAIELCRQLDGIPLAIEMAAARLPTLGIEAVRRLVADWLLRNPTRSAPARQQTLRAALEWSHALLAAGEQAVLRRLAVFAGSFGLDAALQVGAADGLDRSAALDAITALVGSSLLQVARLEPPRYRLLETLRMFASEQLAVAGETEAALLRHGRAMTELAQVMERDYWVSADAAWLDRYKPDFDDILAACDRAVGRLDAEAVAPLMLELRRFDYLLGIRSTIARRAGAAAAVLSSAAPRARAMLWGTLTAVGIPGQSPVEAAREAVAAWRRLGDVPWLYRSLCVYAAACAGAHDASGADRALREAFALERPDWPLRLRLFGAESAAAASGYYEPVDTYRERSSSALVLARAAGADRSALCARLELANAALMAGDLDEAIVLAQAIVTETSASGHSTTLCEALTTLCAALSRKGDLSAARSAGRQALPMALRDKRPWPLFDHLAALAALMGHAERAAKLLGLADAWNMAIHRRRRPSEARSAELAAELIDAALGEARYRQLRAEGARLPVAQGDALAEEVLAASPRR